jgi:translation initiation factor 3 subunit H
MAAIIEADAPVTSVKLEGLAALKIIKHCQESLPTMVTGSLLGLMIEDGCLEITHAFPFPEPLDDNRGDIIKTGHDDDYNAKTIDDEAAALDGHEYQLEMMKMLREVNVDNNCVGWYQSMYLGTHSTMSLLENQLAYQADLSPNAVVILYDPMQTAHGQLVLKCYRLTDEAVRLRMTGKNNFIKPANIFQEVPVTLNNPGLIRALLRDMGDGLHGSYCGAKTTGADTTFDRLDLSTNPYLEKHLEFLCSWVDDLAAEQYKFQHYTRGLRNNVDNRNAKGRKAKEELAAAIEEGWARNDAPRRLESLLMTNQIKTYCDQVEKFAGGGFGKLYLTKGLHCEEKKLAESSSSTSTSC